MPVYREAPAGVLRREYRSLRRLDRANLLSFAGPDSFHERLCQGDFLLLRRRFRLHTVGVFRGPEPVLLATRFRPREDQGAAALPASVGAIVAAPDLRPEEAALFWAELARRDERLVTPLNGHHYLGFGLAPPGADPGRVGFQTAAPHALREAIFAPLWARQPYREYLSFETPVTNALVSRLEAELGGLPEGFRVRRFRPWSARRDFSTMNFLVNRCFTKHFDFAPISDEENWDIFRFAIPLLRRDHLLFLEHESRPVGFCLGMYDYNRVFRARDGDLRNFSRLLLPRRHRRARLIHIGLLPEYQGRGLIKQLRHRVLLSFAQAGVERVENSYIDEGNAASQGNVRSTGARPLHRFRLLSVDG